jgi:hypothetical protein
MDLQALPIAGVFSKDTFLILEQLQELQLVHGMII